MYKVEKNETNLENCSCPGCPSHNDCAKKKNEKLFCAAAIGKSTCDISKNGCICGGCPVHEKFNLVSGYYCKQGSADKIDVI